MNKVLIESPEKADKQKKMAKKHSPKEIENMKKAHNTASAFTTIMSNMLDKSIGYEDFDEMNQDMLNQVNLTTEEKPTGHSKEKSFDSSYNEDEAPPPKKKTKSSFLSVLKTRGEDSDNEYDDIVDLEDDDGEEDKKEEEEDN
jgi:hypothetical protein